VTGKDVTNENGTNDDTSMTCNENKHKDNPNKERNIDKKPKDVDVNDLVNIPPDTNGLNEAPLLVNTEVAGNQTEIVETEKEHEEDIDDNKRSDSTSRPPNKITARTGINPKVVEVINSSTNEIKIILNEKEYYPDENLPTKLTQWMTSFGDNIKKNLRFFLTEIQQENKVTAMSLIRHLNTFLKVFRK